ncbi:MAG: Cytochrome c peroxidase family protein [Labilithrix sp.]|nr:Cytochrome c peroxidase family protein [Labilithrix sp.]
MRSTSAVGLLAFACLSAAGAAACGESDKRGAPGSSPGSQPASDAGAPPVRAYDPYPPGILPADLDAEVARVLREVDALEATAMEEWRAQKGAGGTAAIEVLGKLMNYDKSMSTYKNVSCASCHMPYTAFGGPIPSVNLTMVAYPGTAHYRAGKRATQRYTYSPFFPVLQYNQTQGLFFGGNFWDSRATGYLVRNPDAEQSQHPPVDTQEMGFSDTACIAYRLSQSAYRPLFEQVWGAGSLDIAFPADAEQICATPGGASMFGGSLTPVALAPTDRTHATTVFNHWAQSIDAYEQSVQVSPFSSKFDAFLAGSAQLTADEAAGLKLFDGKANCNSCHLDGRGAAAKSGQSDTSAAAEVNPLFTCFGSANLGVPLNPRVAIYYQTTPDSLGFTANTLGFGYRDLGLGTFLRSGVGSATNPNSTWTQYAPKTDGQMQTSSARNAAMTPPQCPSTEAPGPYFQKAFFHNGYIKSLKQLVHFYNTRDVFKFDVTSGHCPAGKTEKVDCWPRPEVPNNIDMTTGNLGLTDREEDQVVAFMQTLTDGFTKPYPHGDSFTGACMTGGSAKTQGNELLIPTPELPPCATAVCGLAPLPNPPIR